MTKEYTISDYIYVTAEVVVGLLAIFTNSVLLFALWRYRRLRTLTTYFVSSLGSAGLCMGMVLPTVAAVLLTGLPSTFYPCVLVVCLVNTLPTLTTLSLLCVVIDRYCHVLHPVAYLRWATKARVEGMLTVTWLLGLLVGFSPFVWHKDPEGFQVCSCSRVLDEHYTVYFFFLGFLVPVLLTLLALILRVLTAFHVSNSRYRGRNLRLTSITVDSGHMLHRKEIFLFKRLTLVYILLVASSLPVYLLAALMLWVPTIVVHPDVSMFLVVLSHISVFTNPLVYTYKRREFHLIVASVWPLHHEESPSGHGQSMMVHPPQAKGPVSGHYSFIAMSSGNVPSSSGNKNIQDELSLLQSPSKPQPLASLTEETGCLKTSTNHAPTSSLSRAKDLAIRKGAN